MNKELEEILYKKYPVLFQQHSLSPTESCMGRGICVGDGWFHLINGLCENITNYIKNHNSQVKWHIDYKKNNPTHQIPIWAVEIPEVVFLQIKQKLSSLTIYYTGGDDRIDGMISFATFLSSRICEECGSFDTTVGKTSKGYLYVVCQNCVTKRDIANGWKLLSELS